MKHWLRSWLRWVKDRWQAVRHALRRGGRRWLQWGKQQGETLHWNVSDFFSALARPLVLLWRLFREWWQTRKFIDLLWALPAMLLGGGVIVLGFVIALDQGSELRAMYQRAGTNALRSKNFAAARIAYERLALLDNDRPENRYALALAVEAQGEPDRAAAIMVALANRDGGEYAPAHLWLGRQMLSKGTALPPSLMARAEGHLKQALRLQPALLEAHALLAPLYLERKRWDEAEKHLLPLVTARPEFGLLLATVYSERGDKEQFRTWVERSARIFQDQLKADPADHPARLNLAEAQLKLGQFAQAITLLKEGLAMSGNPVYSERIAKTCGAWADSISPDTTEGHRRRLALYHEGLLHNPSHPLLLRRLLDATRSEGPDGDKARELLQTMLADGKGSPALHLLLGIDAFKRGEFDRARLHLDQAYQQTPNMPIVANNLAWVLTNTDPPELDRALAIINSVVERSPTVPGFRDTRGQILAKMGRWKEALPDLETALAAAPEDSRLHKSLAEVYSKLNMPDMARLHQDRASRKKP
jgi:tetratricopeptide (TPR) repeat protein